MKKNTVFIGLFFICLSFNNFAQKLKILPLGNSITYDYRVSDGTSPRPASERLSYRYQLYQLLNAAGYTWDFIGNSQCGSPSLPYNAIDSLDYSDNAGFPGITPAQLITLLNTGVDHNGNCAIESKFGGCNNNYLQKYQPDVILLHIGTNGLTDHASAESHRNNVVTILDIIDDYETWAGKQVVVFLAQIISRESATGAAEHEPTSYYNSLLADVVAARPSDKIVLVNLETGAGIDYKNTSAGGDMADTWHPVLSGYNKMGQKWFDAISLYNIKAPVVGNIQNFTFNYIQQPYQLNLNPYVFDPQDPDAEITWNTVNVSTKYNITFNNGIATITPKDPALACTEVITFRATDSGNGGTPLQDSDACTISYTVTNQKPIITGPDSFTIDEDEDLPLSLTSFQIDDDNTYPDDSTLYINPGANYTVSNTTVIPDANFNGELSVPVYVFDGLMNSDVKIITVVVNALEDSPFIILPEQRIIPEESAFSAVITGGDPDAGDNVSISTTGTLPSWLSKVNNTASVEISGTPDDAEIGTHIIHFRVSDTKSIVDSVLILEVISVNDVPTVLGTTRNLYTPVNTPYEVSLSDLSVTDDDNDYPEDFELSLGSGSNYTFSGQMLTPASGFIGHLDVPVVVSDGLDTSDQKIIKVAVGVTNIPDIPDCISVFVYPNPARKFINIDFSDSNECMIQMFDSGGRLLYSSKKEEHNHQVQIPLDGMSSGIYLLKMIYPKSILVTKIDVQK